MSYEQIRTAFDRTASLTARARAFADQRINQVSLRNTWKPLENSPMCVAEFIPLSCIAGRSSIDIKNMHSGGYRKFIFNDWGSASRSLNLEGLVMYPSTGEKLLALNQVFRNGCVEAIKIAGAEDNGRKLIWSKVVTDFFHEATDTFLAFSREHAITGPAIFTFALVGVSGYSFAVDPAKYYSFRPYAADRENLILPEVWLEDISLAIDAKGLLSETMDILWQCFGMPQAFDQS